MNSDSQDNYTMPAVADTGRMGPTTWMFGLFYSRIALVGLALIGLFLWKHFGKSAWNGAQLLVVGIAVFLALLTLIPVVGRAVDTAWNWLASPSWPVRVLIALAICVGSACFLDWTQRLQGIPFQLKYQDEFSYTIQMRMMAAGKLWMPGLPVPQFFETIWVIVQPVYASMYFPGTALMYLPSIFLGNHYYYIPLLASGMCCAMLYLVLTEVLDGATGLLGVVMLVSFSVFRMLSIQILSETPTILLGLVAAFAYLRWRRRWNVSWMIVLGGAAGWMLITRPADALCYVLALGTTILLDLRGQPTRRWIATLLVGGVAALPFIGLQLAFDKGVTGHWTRTPYDFYVASHMPGATFGFHRSVDPLIVSDMALVQGYYSGVAPLIDEHRWNNIKSLIKDRVWAFKKTAFPTPLFWFVLPLAFLAMWDRRFWVLWGVGPIFMVLYIFFAFFLWHYVGPLFVPVIFVCLLPIRFLTDLFSSQRAMVRAFFAVAIIGLCCLRTPLFDHAIHDQHMETPELVAIDEMIQSKVVPPAVVMMHYNLLVEDGEIYSDDGAVDPAYNHQLLWPLDSSIVRAQDRNTDIAQVGRPGDADLALYEYYRRADPARVFYLLDRGYGYPALHRLGTASEMVARATQQHTPDGSATVDSSIPDRQRE